MGDPGIALWIIGGFFVMAAGALYEITGRMFGLRAPRENLSPGQIARRGRAYVIAGFVMVVLGVSQLAGGVFALLGSVAWLALLLGFLWLSARLRRGPR